MEIPKIIDTDILIDHFFGMREAGDFLEGIPGTLRRVENSFY